MKILLVLVLLGLPAIARGQHLNVASLDGSANVATLTTGAEHGLVVGVGYARVQPVADRALVLGGELAFGLAEPDVSDFRVRAGALAPIAARGPWRLLGGATAILRGTENDLGRLTNVGVDLAIVAGRYARRGFVAAELGFDWGMATYVAHSDAYRRVVYEDARDAWHGNAAGTLRAGVQAGVAIGRHDLVLRAGRTVAVGEPGLIPFYATLSLDTRW